MRKNHTLTVCALLLAFFLLTAAGCAGAEKSIVLTFTGDCTLGSEETTRGRDDSFDTLATKKGYGYFFANFREMFEQDDQTVINFEGVLSDSRNQKSNSKRYCFRGPTDFAKILTGSSIDACSLSNNHTADFGKQGEDSTKATLDANGVGWFQNSKHYIYEKDGIRIAFIATDNKYVFNQFDKIKKTISSLKEKGEAHFVVICWHTGMEYHGQHEPNTESICRKMVSFGADLIIINHPHVLQGIGVYNNRCVFYSLGNFVFGGNSAIRTESYKYTTVSSLYTMVVQVRLLFTDDGRYLGQQPVIYPAYTSNAVPVNNYQPYRVSAEEAVPVREALQADTPFELPQITVGADGLSKIELSYLAAFDDVEIPESEPNSPQGVPEAPSPTVTRNTRSR